MPELPEVQTIVDDLRAGIRGREIASVKTITRSIWRHNYPRRSDIAGSTVTEIRRKGKFMILFFSNNRTLIIHLGMTGRLIFMPTGTRPAKHTHVIFGFADFELHFNDIRRFGFLDIVGTDNLKSLPYLNKLGPDPFEIERDEFIRIIRSRNRMIKPFLLDQSIISGLGNIYSDEALFKAGIHPRKISVRISGRKLANLYDASREILTTAITARGSSISNYVDGSGAPGAYQNSHLVYGREGQPCAICGTRIKREVIGSRSAHFCPRCQR